MLKPKKPKGTSAKIGRPRGARNKRTLAVLAVAEAGGIMPLDHLLRIMRDADEDLDLRLRAAIAAAPYCHAKLSAIEHTGRIGNSQEDFVKSMGL